VQRISDIKHVFWPTSPAHAVPIHPVHGAVSTSTPPKAKTKLSKAVAGSSSGSGWHSIATAWCRASRQQPIGAGTIWTSSDHHQRSNVSCDKQMVSCKHRDSCMCHRRCPVKLRQMTDCPTLIPPVSMPTRWEDSSHCSNRCPALQSSQAGHRPSAITLAAKPANCHLHTSWHQLTVGST